ncbi:MAG: hypothetical protein U0Q16_21860 [Bryobacteraceae bacterium]
MGPAELSCDGFLRTGLELSDVSESLGRCRRQMRQVKITLTGILTGNLSVPVDAEHLFRLSRIVAKIAEQQPALAEEASWVNDTAARKRLEQFASGCANSLSYMIDAVTRGQGVMDTAERLREQTREARRYLRSRHTGLLMTQDDPLSCARQCRFHERFAQTLALYEQARRVACQVELENR